MLNWRFLSSVRHELHVNASDALGLVFGYGGGLQNEGVANWGVNVEKLFSLRKTVHIFASGNF